MGALPRNLGGPERLFAGGKRAITMQTKGHNYGFAVNYGRAGYVATGRGYAIDPSSMVTIG